MDVLVIFPVARMEYLTLEMFKRQGLFWFMVSENLIYGQLASQGRNAMGMVRQRCSLFVEQRKGDAEEGTRDQIKSSRS